MKLAILSGTFDPIHKSHIALAEYVRDNFDYEKILLIPAYKSPFKPESETIARHRLNMVYAAAKELPAIEVSEIEFENTGTSYSYLTVKKLYERTEIDGKIGFIIGTDAYIHLEEWYKAEEFKKLVKFIVFEREISFEDERVKKIQTQGFEMLKASMPFVDISSSAVRERFSAGNNISDLVPKAVEEYIKENANELYK